MAGMRILFVLWLAMAAGCATQPRTAGLAMSADDEAAAAYLLAGYMMGRGWTVRLAEQAEIEAGRDSDSLRLVPLLDPQGLDRILVSRHWPAADGADVEDLAAFAAELNNTLNVGLFSPLEEGLAFEASLAFLDVLDPQLLDAFVAFTAEVRQAVLQVQGERRLLAPVEGEAFSR
jgi:hypothetical protein